MIHLPKIIGNQLPKWTEIQELRKKDIIPQAIVNTVALLGWQPFGSGVLSKFDETSKKFTMDHLLAYVKWIYIGSLILTKSARTTQSGKRKHCFISIRNLWRMPWKTWKPLKKNWSKHCQMWSLTTFSWLRPITLLRSQRLRNGINLNNLVTYSWDLIWARSSSRNNTKWCLATGREMVSPLK